MALTMIEVNTKPKKNGRHCSLWGKQYLQSLKLLVTCLPWVVLGGCWVNAAEATSQSISPAFTSLDDSRFDRPDFDLVSEQSLCPGLRGDRRSFVLRGWNSAYQRELERKDRNREHYCRSVQPGESTPACAASSRYDMNPTIGSQRTRESCHIFAVSALLEYKLNPSVKGGISQQCMARFSTRKDRGCAWELLKTLIHQPRIYPHKLISWDGGSDNAPLTGGLFSRDDCPYTLDRDAIPESVMHTYPTWLEPSDLRVALPRLDSGEDPVDFIRDKIRTGHVALASMFTSNLTWWNDRNTSTDDAMAREKEDGAKIVERGASPRDARLRRVYTGSRRLPALSVSPSFRNFVYAINHPLQVPSERQTAKECLQLNIEAQAQGIPDETLFQERTALNGLKSDELHFGSHAIVITGYNDDESVLEFRNSWGGSWKDQGYGYMTYAYFRRFLQSYWFDELPVVAYKPSEDGDFHTVPHPQDCHPDLTDP